MYTYVRHKGLGGLESYDRLDIDPNLLGKGLSQDWYCVSTLSKSLLLLFLFPKPSNPKTEEKQCIQKCSKWNYAGASKCSSCNHPKCSQCKNPSPAAKELADWGEPLTFICVSIPGFFFGDNNKTFTVSLLWPTTGLGNIVKLYLLRPHSMH